MNDIRYVVVTPTKNEEKYIERTIVSMIKQKVRPIKWIVVDDCSSDSTSEIVSMYRKEYPWIQLFRLDHDKGRRPGKGVIEAFEFGLNKVTGIDFDYIVKLDADVEFDSNFFENIFEAFKKNEKLGIGSGAWHDLVDGNKRVLKQMFNKHTAGQTKVYRKKCYDDIGGLIHFKGWDLYDNICANVKGWETKWIPEAEFTHLRPEGKEKGFIREEFNVGSYEGRLRYAAFFALAKAVMRMKKKPYVIAGLAQITGYLCGILLMPKIGSKEERKYLRSQQYSRVYHSLRNHQNGSFLNLF
jgi:glycosyltransferase involved in cell wall biosynthesis